MRTAINSQDLRRVAIDPLTRVEGHGKVTLLLDEQNRVQQARLHIVEFRGFEKFIQGRPYWELPVVVQRLCGICPVSHHLAAAKACDQITGAHISTTADKVRRLMHYGQVLQSHALHFFHLSSPDLLFGFDDTPEHRNIFGLIADKPEIAEQGVKLRKFGQEVIRIVSGKRVHGVAAIPGGVNKALTRAERDELKRQMPDVLTWAQSAVSLMRKIAFAEPDYLREFAAIESSMLSLVNDEGGFELYDGALRARTAAGATLFDHCPDDDYARLISESVKPWSYMKFPFIRTLGEEAGWYRVGPLARLNNCEFMSTPLAEDERRLFRTLDDHLPVQSTLAYHWARLIELLHCAELIDALLDDDDLSGEELLQTGQQRRTGIGVIEAPRGTLIHHYEVNDDGLVDKANLIVSTTHNNQAMNESVRAVSRQYFDGREVTEALLNRIEIAVRAYDPCLSCATHALGQMPLQVDLISADGMPLQRAVRDHLGQFARVTGEALSQ